MQVELLGGSCLCDKCLPCAVIICTHLIWRPPPIFIFSILGGLKRKACPVLSSFPPHFACFTLPDASVRWMPSYLSYRHQRWDSVVSPGPEPVSEGGRFRKEADSWASRVSGKLINTLHAQGPILPNATEGSTCAPLLPDCVRLSPVSGSSRPRHLSDTGF